MTKLVTVSINNNADGSVVIDLNDGIMIASSVGKFPEIYLTQSIDNCILQTGQMRCLISLENAKKLLALGATAKGHFDLN